VSHGEKAGAHGTLYVDLKDLLSPYKSIGLDPMSASGRGLPSAMSGSSAPRSHRRKAVLCPAALTRCYSAADADSCASHDPTPTTLVALTISASLSPIDYPLRPLVRCLFERPRAPSLRHQPNPGRAIHAKSRASDAVPQEAKA